MLYFPPLPPLSLFLLDVNPCQWGERNPLFLVEAVVVVVTEEKAVVLSLPFAALLFIEDKDSDIDIWWWDCKRD